MKTYFEEFLKDLKIKYDANERREYCNNIQKFLENQIVYNLSNFSKTLH